MDWLKQEKGTRGSQPKTTRLREQFHLQDSEKPHHDLQSNVLLLLDFAHHYSYLQCWTPSGYCSKKTSHIFLSNSFLSSNPVCMWELTNKPLMYKCFIFFGCRFFKHVSAFSPWRWQPELHSSSDQTSPSVLKLQKASAPW